MAFVTSCKKKETATPPETPQPQAGDVQSMPYTQTFDESFGTYITKNVLGDQKWEIDYSTAKMSGYVDGNNYANEDWLISSPVNVKNVEHAKMAVEYIARYFNNINSDITFWASVDYKNGNAPSTATWTQLPAQLVSGSNWNDWYIAQMSLDAFIGSKVTVAVKYLSDNVKAGTIEIKSIAVKEGEVPGGGGGTPGEIQEMPYTQSFATEFGTYVPKSVIGDQTWVIDFSTAKISGYAGGTNYENEDWLISSPIEITGVTHAKAVVNYVAQYQAPSDNDLTMQVSTNYVWNEDPTAATWTELNVKYPNTSGWNDFQDKEVSLDAYIGQTITIAMKFTSTTQKSRTIEIKKITVEEGETGGGPVGPTTGDGSRENPYTADDVISLGIETSDGNSYWVKDYIVGTIETGGYTYIYSGNATVATNLIISSDVNTSSDDACVPVQLPVGEVRQGLNLVDNPGNYKQEVLLYGTLEKYFQKAGVKNVTYAEINGNSFGTDPGATPPVIQAIYSETFANGQGDFSIIDVNIPMGLTYVWAHNSQYKCMKASAYYQQAYETESWLVSPLIDLSATATAVLSFDHCCKYETNPDQEMTAWITTNYTGNVSTTEWDPIALTYSSNFVFANTGDIDLAAYVGSNVVIAFKYVSTSASAPSWEIKNFLVKE